VLCVGLRSPMDIAGGLLPRRMKLGAGSSKTMAAVPATSAGALRYGVRRGCGRRRSGGFDGARRGVGSGSGVGSRLPQHCRNWLEKFDLFRGVAAIWSWKNQNPVQDREKTVELNFNTYSVRAFFRRTPPSGVLQGP